MFIKLLPEQVSVYWDIIKHGCQQVLPPMTADNDAAMNDILKKLLMGQFQCWISTEPQSDRFKCFVISEIATDTFSDQRFFRLYVLYGVRPLTEEDWQEGFEKLQTFAKHNNCTVMTGYTNNEYLCEKLEKFGLVKTFSVISKRL
jgi:hypothetical protein